MYIHSIMVGCQLSIQLSEHHHLTGVFHSTFLFLKYILGFFKVKSCCRADPGPPSKTQDDLKLDLMLTLQEGVNLSGNKLLVPDIVSFGLGRSKIKKKYGKSMIHCRNGWNRSVSLMITWILQQTPFDSFICFVVFKSNIALFAVSWNKQLFFSLFSERGL